MRLVISRPTEFKKVVQVLRKIAEEAPFVVNANGVSCRVLSEDKSALLSLTLPSAMFESVEVEVEESFKVKTKDLTNVAKRLTRNDVLAMELDRENKVLRLLLQHKKTGAERVFEIPVSLEVGAEIGEISVTHPVTFELLASDFKEIVADLKIAGDEVQVTYAGGRIILRSETATRVYEAVLEKDNPLAVLSAEEEPVSATYAVDLLVPAARMASASTMTRISFGENAPMQIKFDLKGEGTVTYWIAPRA